VNERRTGTTFASRRRRVVAGVSILIVAVTLAGGCVVERTPVSGTPVKRGGTAKAEAARPTGDPQRTSKGESKGDSGGKAPAKLPEGPIARPEPGRRVATDISVEVQPRGSVRYDGQALPVASPDGRWLAVQEGEPPTWETILAQPNAMPAAETRVVVYDLNASSATKVTLAEPLQAGFILGRGADDEGFLVEAARIDGTRWIGKASWLTGRVRWLASGDAVNAFGFLTPRGELLYSRRVLHETDFELVVRAPDGHESAKRALDGSYTHPLSAAGEDSIFVFRHSRSGTDLETIGIDRRDEGKPRLGQTRQQWRILSAADPVVAHQMAGTFSGGAAGDVVAMFDPRKNRAARFDPSTGAVEGLISRSIGAAASSGTWMTPGYFCTTPGGLVFIAQPSDGWPVSWPDDGPVARVLASPYVARPLRPTEKGVPMYLLVGPVKGDERRLEITRMAVTPPPQGR
jgi:hypothetical protein